MNTDYYRWIDEKCKPFGSLRPSQLLLKIVVSPQPKWFSEEAFIEIKLGEPVSMGTRYIFFISEVDLKENWHDDLEELAKYLEERILEANK